VRVTIAKVSTTNEMIPRLIAGLNALNGKRNPVRLVNAVVSRKTAVQRSSLWLMRNPYITTITDPIPRRLINT
jgi:hypothetical protein